jgi:molybdate transport system substrate-binding protein
MKMKRPTNTKSNAARIAAASALITVALGNGGPASAADIYVLSAAAMQSVFKEIAGDFQRTTGHKLSIRYATMGSVTERIRRGEHPGLVIGSTQSITSLVQEGKIRADSQVTICKTGVGVVVPAGTPRFEIASADDLKRALRSARIIVYADPAGGGAAGIHIARVIESLGLADELKAKTKFGAGGDITEVTLAEGSGALGMTQISEIVGKMGADFVGPLPGELQNYTGVTAAIPTDLGPSEAVASFIRYLQGPKAVAVIKAKGMEVD